MNSCNFESLNTAFGRFSEIEACDIAQYESEKGQHIQFVQSKPKHKKNLTKYLSILTDLSFAGQDLTGEKIGIVENEINKYIMIERRTRSRLWVNNV